MTPEDYFTREGVIDVCEEDRYPLMGYKYQHPAKLVTSRVKEAVFSQGDEFIRVFMEVPKRPERPRDVHAEIRFLKKSPALLAWLSESEDLICRAGFRGKKHFFNKHYYPDSIPHTGKAKLRACRHTAKRLVRKILTGFSPKNG